MNSSHINKIYNSIRQRLFSNKEEKVVQNDTDNDLSLCFVGFFQDLCDKTAYTLSSLLPILSMLF